MDEVSEHHENFGDAQREQMGCQERNIDDNDSDFEFHAMPSAKSAESLQNLKSMSPMFRQMTSEPESLEHFLLLSQHVHERKVRVENVALHMCKASVTIENSNNFSNYVKRLQGSSVGFQIFMGPRQCFISRLAKKFVGDRRPSMKPICS